ncbi:hypothetical protein GCM10022222_29300 [Amycolatopsis ultiminotia]|uniref:Glycine transporter domain-containing protein n=1 Tax=Amycolatopsis ultiminotia TaxID=543629 RepID=A0ABP6W3V9_9PSEU
MFLVMEALGIVAFAFAGAMDGARSRLDLFGIGTAAILTAIGGGVLRDILLGVEPPVGLQTTWYFLAGLATAAAVVLWYPHLSRLNRSVQFCDAVGLAMFAITGATKAMEHGTSVYVAGIIGLINGVGGGLMRDVLIRRVPTVLRKEIYALPALGGGILVGVGFILHLPSDIVAVVTVPIVVAVRMLAILLNWHLPTTRLTRTGRTPADRRQPAAIRPGPGSSAPGDSEQTLELFLAAPATPSGSDPIPRPRHCQIGKRRARRFPARQPDAHHSHERTTEFEVGRHARGRRGATGPANSAGPACCDR